MISVQGHPWSQSRAVDWLLLLDWPGNVWRWQYNAHTVVACADLAIVTLACEALDGPALAERN